MLFDLSFFIVILVIHNLITFIYHLYITMIEPKYQRRPVYDRLGYVNRDRVLYTSLGKFKNLQETV